GSNGIHLAEVGPCHINNNQIINNIVYGGNYSGIIIGATADYNLVQSNIAYGNGPGANQSGIQVDTSDHETIVGNQVYSQDWYGIFLQADSFLGVWNSIHRFRFALVTSNGSTNIVSMSNVIYSNYIGIDAGASTPVNLVVNTVLGYNAAGLSAPDSYEIG